MELTKEYFDKGIANLMETNREDLAKLEASLRLDMATKSDLKAQSEELKQYVHQAFEIQQTWTEERFKEVMVACDVRDRVYKLEKDVADLKVRRPLHN